MNRYILPIAGKRVMGAFKVGKNLDVDKDGTLHVTGIEQIENRLTQTIEDITAAKEMLANAITQKGVDTAADAAFSTMANNILRISSGTFAGIPIRDVTIKGYCGGIAGAVEYDEE